MLFPISSFFSISKKYGTNILIILLNQLVILSIISSEKLSFIKLSISSSFKKEPLWRGQKLFFAHISGFPQSQHPPSIPSVS